MLYETPSIYAHTLNGALLLVAAYLTFLHFSSVKRLDPFRLIVLTLALSVAVGVHGLSHLGLENLYSYNPIHLARGVFV
jgi:hypothetical protein